MTPIHQIRRPVIFVCALLKMENCFHACCGINPRN